MDFRQLLPQPAERDLDELLDGLELAARAPGDRPYVAVNFVSSADGRVAFKGRSGALGDDGDHAMFHGLRERADAVLAGTGTMNTERYGRMLGSAERRARRTDRGLQSEPLAVTITRSGEVDLEIPLYAEPEARVAIYTGAEIDTSATAAQLELVQLVPDELTPTTVLRHLHAELGVRSVLCEGGPGLFGAMLAEGVVDELFLTLAPKLTGGGGAPAITSGPELPEPVELKLAWVLQRNGYLFLRYTLNGGAGPGDRS